MKRVGASGMLNATVTAVKEKTTGEWVVTRAINKQQEYKYIFLIVWATDSNDYSGNIADSDRIGTMGKADYLVAHQ